MVDGTVSELPEQPTCILNLKINYLYQHSKQTELEHVYHVQCVLLLRIRDSKNEGFHYHFSVRNLFQ